MGFLLIPPMLLLVAGLLCLLKPKLVASYFAAFARPMGGAESNKALRIKIQEEQVTARPRFITLLGTVFSALGLILLARVLPFLLEASSAG